MILLKRNFVIFAKSILSGSIKIQEFTQEKYSEKHKNIYIIKISKFSVLTAKNENKYNVYVKV